MIDKILNMTQCNDIAYEKADAAGTGTQQCRNFVSCRTHAGRFAPSNGPNTVKLSESASALSLRQHLLANEEEGARQVFLFEMNECAAGGPPLGLVWLAAETTGKDLECQS